MAKHDCDVPATSAKRWKCPTCKRVWTWNPNAGKGADLWYGRDNVRKANGSKPNTSFLDWLFD